jgi:hypothetical protein
MFINKLRFLYLLFLSKENRNRPRDSVTRSACYRRASSGLIRGIIK